jgi:hypothetical protein
VNRPFLELPEAADKVIRNLRIYDDPPYGREVHIVFTDDTQISIDLAVETTVSARHYRSDKANLEVLQEHCEKSLSGTGPQAA